MANSSKQLDAGKSAKRGSSAEVGDKYSSASGRQSRNSMGRSEGGNVDIKSISYDEKKYGVTQQDNEGTTIDTLSDRGYRKAD